VRHTLFFDQHRIAEFVGPVTSRLERRARCGKRDVADERTEKLIMTAVWLVGARKDRIDDPQTTCRAYPLIRQPRTSEHTPVLCGGMFQGAHYCRADGHDPAPFSLRPPNR
jgi:hypothetical protein